MKAIVIEDHFHALQDLLSLLSEICPEVEVLGNAATQTDAVRLIRDVKPDLVFMDVELADGGDGFSVMEQIALPHIQVVFISAYGQFAIRAFRSENTVDFLQKPVQEEELRQAVDRALAERTLRENDTQYRLWRDTIIQAKRPRIALADQQRIVFPYLDTVIHIQAEGASSIFYFEPPQARMMVTKNIGVYAKMEEEYPALLMQVHRSHIVNITKVVEYLRPLRQAVMSTGEKIPVAIDKLDDFLQRLSRVHH